jgi:hypothetical protein
MFDAQKLADLFHEFHGGTPITSRRVRYWCYVAPVASAVLSRAREVSIYVHMFTNVSQGYSRFFVQSKRPSITMHTEL